MKRILVHGFVIYQFKVLRIHLLDAQFNIFLADDARYYPDVGNQAVFITIHLHPISQPEASTQSPSPFDTTSRQHGGAKRAKTSHSASVHGITSTPFFSEPTQSPHYQHDSGHFEGQN